eukprot:COSAG02_NODE_441_length_22281_cov_6.119556_3_plen_67_part_00
MFGPHDRHYLLEHGDSQSISDHVLNSARATSPGIRLLVKQWAEREEKAIENYCGFRSEIFLNNRDA